MLYITHDYWLWPIIYSAVHPTVDRENFAVKINSRSRPTAKIKHAKNKLRSDTQWISLRASPHSPIDDYSEQSLVFLIPGSRLKATNSPSARPYCNRQPLQKFRGSNETAKIYQHEKFSRELFLTRKFPDLRYVMWHLHVSGFTTQAVAISFC